MFDGNLSCVLTAAEDLSPYQGRDITSVLQAAGGWYHPRDIAVCSYLDRLQIAAQAPFQAQRDAAAVAVTSAAQASQRQQQAAAPAQRPARL